MVQLRSMAAHANGGIRSRAIGGIARPDNSVDEFKRHLLELAAGRLEFVDFAGGEDVAGGLIPIWGVVDGVKDETELALDVLAPVPAWRHRQPPQVQPPDEVRYEDAVAPKPPRRTGLIRAG